MTQAVRISERTIAGPMGTARPRPSYARRPLDADVVEGLSLSSGTISRLSEHGALLATSIAPEVGARIVVRLWLSARSPLTVLAVVRGRVRGNAGEPSGLVVQFVGVDSASRGELRTFLASGLVAEEGTCHHG